jgi:nicotinate-nucleotide adenylyltransferase
MKLAILGGSFNPVHKGHIFLADEVHKRLGYELIVMIPARVSPFKQAFNTAETSEKRLSALLAAAEGRRYLTVDDCELLREGVSWTIDTVKDVITRYQPAGKLGLILGDDLAADFPKWKNAPRILELCDLIIASRVTDTLNFPYPYIKLNNAPFPVSSSMIREKIARKDDWHDLLPAPGHENAMEAIVRNTLRPERFIHSRNTALIASRLARRFSLDEDAAYLAGITHDIAKEISTPLEHGARGAELLSMRYGITHTGVLEAVRVHTKGEIGMSALAKIVYIADKVEWRRKSEELIPLRGLLETLPLDELFPVIEQAVHAYLEKSDVRC